MFLGKPDKFVVDNTNDIKAHDQDWEEIGEIKAKYEFEELNISFQRKESRV